MWWKFNEKIIKTQKFDRKWQKNSLRISIKNCPKKTIVKKVIENWSNIMKKTEENWVKIWQKKDSKFQKLIKSYEKIVWNHWEWEKKWQKMVQDVKNW